MPGIDFFDVDHTLTRRSSGTRFISLAIRRKVLPLRLLFIIPYYTFTYRLGVFRMKAYADGFPYLRGVGREVLEEIARESFETKLRGDVFEQAAALIREKKREGRKVVLATSSLDIIVKPLADFLDVKDMIATRMEFINGICTGRVVGAPSFRHEKMDRVLEFISRYAEDKRNCSFYSDSIYDLPLLEEVGFPVAVNPDFRLRRIARRRNWPIAAFS
jgi:HAD superfamily hydrolase (TIGR01490 family)